jgi:hypothetical protein
MGIAVVLDVPKVVSGLYFQNKGKGKVHIRTGHEGPKGE